MAKKKLTIPLLRQEAATFAEIESAYPEPSIYGATDGKAIGTYLEHKFRAHLLTKYTFAPSNSASGIDFPDLEVDMKVTATVVTMGRKGAQKIEFGDFQTPSELAGTICAVLAQNGVSPAAILEPTCGLGNFLFAGLDQFEGVREVLGTDINGEYLDRAAAVLKKRAAANYVKLVRASFFDTDWKQVISELPQPLLILGNPPWVTNSHLGTVGSKNLPVKSNFQKHAGLDALTGKANFDISEWMLIRLFEAMNGRSGTLAMLCKSSTARKTLFYAWKNNVALWRSSVYRIDASFHFDVSVEAVLLVAEFRPGAQSREANVYSDLKQCSVGNIVGYEDGIIVADVAAYRDAKQLLGKEQRKWRSGIKHDCAKVMELQREGTKYRNGLGELVELEDNYVYPMLKSSSVASAGKKGRNRYMIVPQKTVGGDTSRIARKAPKTWAYLERHLHLLSKRGSSIYRGRPAFSIFGVGEYTFAPWKVAISGFYKKLSFAIFGPVNRKPVVFDDTSYFLSCRTKEEADYIAALLNSPQARRFYNAFIFWDSKRPITAELLGRLDLRRLAMELGSEETFYRHAEQNADACSNAHAPVQLELWS